MRIRRPARWLLIAASLAVTRHVSPVLGAVPPGRQHVLTIDGENTVTFAPQSGLTPSKIDYKAQVEYIVNTRGAKEAVAGKKKSRQKPAKAAKTGRKVGASSAAKITSAVDVSVHSIESTFRHNAQTVLESRLSRAQFQGRLSPDMPVLNFSMNEAPLRLQLVLRSFDTTAASMLLDQDSRVVSRKFYPDFPFHAIIETILSIHTPIPRAVASWEAPTQLAMGHGQTAKGMLRFEKQKESVAKTAGLVKVKVAGALKADGVVFGNFIKDGIYTVTGEQTYEPSSHEWKSARWSVDVDYELVNAAGQTIAHSQGTMIVMSRLFEDPSPAREPATAVP